MNNDDFYLEQEVLSEFTAEIIADFIRYIDINKIDKNNKTNAIILIFDELCKLKNSIYSDKMQKMEDLKILEEELLMILEILEI